MKKIKLIRFIEEPTMLNSLDMSQIRGGQLATAGDCTSTYIRCRKYDTVISME